MLDFVYIDSGAMYRAVTLYFLRNAVPIDDEAAVSYALRHIDIDFHTGTGKTCIFLNGEDVSAEIRQINSTVAPSGTLARLSWG